METDSAPRLVLVTVFLRFRRQRQIAVLGFAALLLALLCAQGAALAQKSGARQKLPAPERIVGDYLKAIGGKKRVAGIRDASYEWAVALKGQTMGSAHTQVKAPTSARLDMTFGNGEIDQAANQRSAWVRGLDGTLRTLTDMEANAAKLQATLEASHLVDYKKLNVLARTVQLEETDGEPAYVVEFSLRNGARVRYWFSIKSKLLLKIKDDARQVVLRFGDYRMRDGMLEPHRVERELGQTGALTLTLLGARYNSGIDDKIFDPPSAEKLDVVALLKEVDRNQQVIDERVGEYTFTEKFTEREISDKGEVKKETVRVYEVYPVPGSRFVRKLVSENGVALTPERMAKEEKRVGEEIEKAERERQKETLKRERERAKKGDKAQEKDDDPGISDFLRASELVSPRREPLREREAVVFDFRPRSDYRPRNNIDEIVLKLTGVVWIDPVDKQVLRLEAKLTDNYKVGGGLLAKIRPGTAFVFEQKRMTDGVWLPSLVQVNISAKILIFKGMEINVMQEFSNYQRFKSDVEGYKLGDKPTSPETPQPKSKP
jgi:hypothetical protein